MNNIYLLVIIVSYFLGTIPFGLILTRLAGLGDIRSIGSGNIGATNVLRTGRKSLALLTLILDAAKGALAVLLARYLAQYVGEGEWRLSFLTLSLPELAAIAVVLGHMLPITLRFRGGKGVATSLGVLLALSWPIGLSAAAVWIVVAAMSRYSSLAALMASAAAPAVACISGQPLFTMVTILILAIAIWIRHRGNVIRLWRGAESKIGS